MKRTKMSKAVTTKPGNDKRIIDGLKAAIAYVKGDKTKGRLTRITVRKP